MDLGENKKGSHRFFSKPAQICIDREAGLGLKLAHQHSFGCEGATAGSSMVNTEFC